MNPEVTQALNKYRRGEELTREELRAIALEMPDMVECITNMAATVAAWLKEALPRWASIIADCVRIASDTQEAISTCTNRRVAHLARYGRTRRIRKKNIRRALKILKEAKR